MKRQLLSGLLLSLLLFMSCNNTQEPQQSQESPPPAEDYEQIQQGEYKAYYGENNQLKMEGYYDQDGQRHGIWTYYTPEGKKQSITEYRHGLRHGYSIVYHPNGALYYRGEWHNDQQVGIWDYYDPTTGTKIETQDYGTPTKK